MAAVAEHRLDGVLSRLKLSAVPDLLDNLLTRLGVPHACSSERYEVWRRIVLSISALVGCLSDHDILRRGHEEVLASENGE